MKAFDLKSMSWLMALAMMFTLSFTSCSDDDESKNEGKVEFPTLQEATCNVDGTIEISFKAGAEWQLTSNAGWCKFVNGDFTESTISGKAGEQTVTVKIFNDGQNYTDDDVAEITLSMGGEEQVIYKITRPKKVFSGLIIKDEAGNIYNTENPITVKGNKGLGKSDIVYTTIIVESDFETGISENPDWITVTNEGEGKYSLTFNKENKDGLNLKYPFTVEKGYQLIFGVKTDEERIDVSVPVIYEGFQADAIDISPAYTNAVADVNGEITSGETVATQLVSTITALNDEFKIIEFTQTTNESNEYEFNFPENEDVDWIHAETDKDKVTISVDENQEESERTAIIMVFPKATYDSFNGNLAENIIDPETKDIKSKYNTNVLTVLKQDKLQQQAERISFKADYIYMPGFMMHIASNSGVIPIVEDLKDSQDVGDYNVENNNVWKIVIPKDISNMCTSEEAMLFFEGVGLATGQSVIENTSISDVHGKTITTSTNDPATGLLIQVTGWGIYFDNPDSYSNNYQLVVKENGKILALCIIEIGE